jgi:hypothetical protein
LMALSTAKTGIDVQIILSRVLNPPNPHVQYTAVYSGPLVPGRLAKSGATKEEAVDKVTRILEQVIAKWPFTDHETVSARLIVPERFIVPAQVSEKKANDGVKLHGERTWVSSVGSYSDVPAIQASLMVKTTDDELINLTVIGMDGQLEETLRTITSKAMNISRHSLAELVEEDNASSTGEQSSVHRASDEKPARRYVLAQDGSAHWYIVPLDRLDDFNKWASLDEEKEAAWTPPQYARPIGGSPQLVSFIDPEEVVHASKEA